MGLINAGSQINWGCAYEDERASIPFKIEFRHMPAIVRLNSISFQNTLDIVIPSREKDVPDIPVIIPAGAYVYYIGIRLGKNIEQQNPGDGLKIAAAIDEGQNPLIITPTIPLIDDQPGMYATFPNSPNNPVIPQLGLKAIPYIPKLFSTAAAGNALGGGIRSRDINGSFIGVEIGWYDFADPLPMETFLMGIPRS